MSPEELSQPTDRDPALSAGSIVLARELTGRRMDMLRRSTAELRDMWPEYAGMTLFGSMSRGETRPESDADVFVFVRPEPAVGLHQDARVPADKVVGRIEAGNQTGTVKFHSHINVKYYSAAAARIEAGGIPRGGVIVLPINTDIIAETTDELLQEAARINEGDETAEGRVPRNVQALFHVPVDDVELRPFQRQVLDALAADDNGDTAWKMIRYKVLLFERRKDEDDLEVVNHRAFAHTLQEARQQFLP